MIHMRSWKTAKDGDTRAHQPGSADSSFQSAPSAEDQTVFVFSAPGSFRPPMSHMRSLKGIVAGRSPWTHAASGVAQTHSTPSEDFHTSRGFGVCGVNQPPKIHMWPSKTISPCESLACQAASRVSQIQSGPGWVVMVFLRDGVGCGRGKVHSCTDDGTTHDRHVQMGGQLQAQTGCQRVESNLQQDR